MLVDLAGSERISYLDKNITREDKTMQKETIGINKSLMALRKVINALISKQNPRNASRSNFYVPYRESKLTALLKQSLGGNSMTIFIACLSPSDDNYDENLSTLQYATRVSGVINAPIKGVLKNRTKSISTVVPAAETDQVADLLERNRVLE